MYIINKIHHGKSVRMVFTHSSVKSHSLAALIRLISDFTNSCINTIRKDSFKYSTYMLELCKVYVFLHFELSFDFTKLMQVIFFRESSIEILCQKCS